MKRVVLLNKKKKKKDGKKHPPIRCTVSCELRNLWKNNFKKQKTELERIKDTIRSTCRVGNESKVMGIDRSSRFPANRCKNLVIGFRNRRRFDDSRRSFPRQMHRKSVRETKKVGKKTIKKIKGIGDVREKRLIRAVVRHRVGGRELDRSIAYIRRLYKRI